MFEHNSFKPLSVNADTNSNVLLKTFWGLSNQLYINSISKARGDGTKTLDKSDAGKHETFKVKWNIDMQSKNMRELVCESRLIFMKVQQVFANENNSDVMSKQISDKVLMMSGQYRSAMQSCIQTLQANKQETPHELEQMEMAEMVLSLCELLFFQPQNAEVGLVSEFLSWCKERFEDKEMYDEVVKSQPPHNHSQFYQLVTTQVMLGDIQTACDLLQLLPQPPQELIFLLKNMPLYQPGVGSEWQLKRSQWTMVCKQHVEDAVFDHQPPLLNICKMLSGDESSFSENLHYMPSWYCHLASKIFYTSPFNSKNLSLYARRCLEEYGGGKVEMTTWDQIMLSLLQLDVKQAIAIYCKSFSNWWLPCHLTDLLYHAGTFPLQTLGYGSDLREYLLLDYASSLVSLPSFLNIALDYFSQCPVYGRWHMEQVIERTPTPTENHANKLISLCVRYGLTQSVKDIGRRQGVASMNDGMFGTSLKWCILIQDCELAVELVTRIMSKYDIADLHFLDTLSTHPHTLTFSDHLIFLGKLVEYHKKLSEDNADEAVEVLMSLFNEKHVSKSYWKKMLNEIYEILQKNQTKLSYKDSLKVLECLDDLDDYTPYLPLKLSLAESLFK